MNFMYCGKDILERAFSSSSRESSQRHALSRFCPENFLDAARRKKHRNYRQFRAPENEESLLELDRASHVPNDSEQTIEFRKIIESYVDKLANQLSAEAFPQLGKVTFTPTPMGSFPCNTKVGDIDEFDYIFLVDNNKLEKDFLEHSKEAKTVGRFESKFEDPATFEQDGGKFGLDILLERITTLLHTTCDLDPENVQTNWVCLTDIYPHGPAIGVELGWRCPRRHKHYVMIDVAFGHLLRNWSLREYLQERQPKLGDQALPAEVYQRLCEKVGTKNTMFVYNGMEWVMSSSFLDQAMFETLQEMCPAIVTAFRILKLLTSTILPSKMVYSIKGYRRCKVTNLISSYHLKTYVLDMFCNTSSLQNWCRHSVSDIVLRIVDVMSVAIEQKEFYLDFLHQGMYSTKVFPPSDLYNDRPWYSAREAADDLRALGRLLQTTGQHGDQNGVEDHTATIYIREKGRTHRANVSFLTEYMKSEIPKIFIHKYGNAVYKQHPLVQRCELYTSELYQKQTGFDLSTFPKLYLVSLWNKYVMGYVSVELMRTFQIKLPLFRAYAQLFEEMHEVKVAEYYDEGKITEEQLLTLTDYRA